MITSTVFLDTNILVSAFTSRGTCAELLELLIERNQILISEEVLEELHRILLEKFSVDVVRLERTIAFLRKLPVLPKRESPPIIRLNDRDDEQIVTAAVMGNASFFITGDKALLALESVRGMKVISPRQFFELNTTEV